MAYSKWIVTLCAIFIILIVGLVFLKKSEEELSKTPPVSPPGKVAVSSPEVAVPSPEVAVPSPEVAVPPPADFNHFSVLSVCRKEYPDVKSIFALLRTRDLSNPTLHNNLMNYTECLAHVSGTADSCKILDKIPAEFSRECMMNFYHHRFLADIVIGKAPDMQNCVKFVKAMNEPAMKEGMEMEFCRAYMKVLKGEGGRNPCELIRKAGFWKKDVEVPCDDRQFVFIRGDINACNQIKEKDARAECLDLASFVSAIKARKSSDWRFASLTASSPKVCAYLSRKVVNVFCSSQLEERRKSGGKSGS